MNQEQAGDSAELEQIQKVLREIAAPHYHLLEALNEGILLTDLNDTLLFCNGRMEELTGYSREELLGRRGYEILLPPDIWSLQQERNFRRKQGLLDIYEVPMIRKDGTLCWVETRASPLRNPEGEIVGTLSANTDITERKKAAEVERNAVLMAERQRLAREMHDTLAQAFTGIIVQLGAAERVIESDAGAAKEHLLRARDLARQGLVEARHSVWALRPKALESHNLCEALAHLGEQMTAGTSLQATLTVEGTPHPLPPEVGLNLLRIGQEALTNTVKYAHANQVTITLLFAPQQVALRVSDTGQGFDLTTLAGQSGFGLRSMRERSERIGGELTIQSQPGAGTQVMVAVPLREAGTLGADDAG